MQSIPDNAPVTDNSLGTFKDVVVDVVDEETTTGVVFKQNLSPSGQRNAFRGVGSAS